MTIAILTPLPLECEAVLTYLNAPQEIMKAGNLYQIGSFKGTQDTYKIIVHQTGSKNNVVALAAERVIQYFKPSIIFLTGIAGGVKDVTLGDIVIGTKAYGYESGKETNQGFVTRPTVFNARKELLTLAQFVDNQGEWKRRIRNKLANPNVVFGPIASGDKVIASIHSPIYKHLKQAYNDTTALEMEAHGMGETMYNHPNILWLNVRGISDLLENKTAKHDRQNQPIAAAHAAAFLFEMIAQIDPTQLNIPIMTAKELSKAIYEILFPISRLESVQDIGKDLAEASNTSIRELWKKVSPYFIEEFEELQEDPKDEDNQTAVKAKLKRVLNKNEALKAELEGMVKAVSEKETGGNSTVIQNSQDVVIGNTIHSGRDTNIGNKTTNIGGNQYNVSGNQGAIHIGDIINIQQVLSSPTQATPTTKKNIQSLLTRGQIKPALEELLRLSESRDNNFQNQIILLASRWNQLNQEKRMGIISNSNANIRNNQILMALLEVVGELD